MDAIDEKLAEKLAAKVKSGELTLDKVPEMYLIRVKEIVEKGV